MAEQKLLKLIISKVNGPVFDGEVVSVIVPGVEGVMTILSDHEALISPLQKGVIIIQKSDGKEETYNIETGTLEISNNQATVLI